MTDENENGFSKMTDDKVCQTKGERNGNGEEVNDGAPIATTAPAANIAPAAEAETATNTSKESQGQVIHPEQEREQPGNQGSHQGGEQNKNRDVGQDRGQSSEQQKDQDEDEGPDELPECEVGGSGPPATKRRYLTRGFETYFQETPCGGAVRRCRPRLALPAGLTEEPEGTRPESQSPDQVLGEHTGYDINHRDGPSTDEGASEGVNQGVDARDDREADQGEIQGADHGDSHANNRDTEQLADRDSIAGSGQGSNQQQEQDAGQGFRSGPPYTNRRYSRSHLRKRRYLSGTFEDILVPESSYCGSGYRLPPPLLAPVPIRALPCLMERPSRPALPQFHVPFVALRFSNMPEMIRFQDPGQERTPVDETPGSSPRDYEGASPSRDGGSESASAGQNAAPVEACDEPVAHPAPLSTQASLMNSDVGRTQASSPVVQSQTHQTLEHHSAHPTNAIANQPGTENGMAMDMDPSPETPQQGTSPNAATHAPPHANGSGTDRGNMRDGDTEPCSSESKIKEIDADGTPAQQNE